MKRSLKKVRQLYVPGLLSLLVFFPVSLYILNGYGAFKQYGVIEVNAVPLKSTDKIIQTQSEFNPYTIDKSNERRLYKTFVLTGDENKDTQSLKEAQTEIKILKTQGFITEADKQHGIHFYFSGKSKYWAYIKALDILRQEEIRFYAPIRNEIWVFNISKPAKEETNFMVCGTSYYRDRVVIQIDNTTSIPKSIKELLTDNKSFWLSVSLFALLATLHVRRIRKGVSRNKYLNKQHKS